MKVTTVATEAVSLPTVRAATLPWTGAPFVEMAEVVVTVAPGAAPVAVSEIWHTAGNGMDAAADRPAGVG